MKGEWLKAVPRWNGYGYMRYHQVKKDRSEYIGDIEIVCFSNGVVGRINYEEDFIQSELDGFEFWSKRIEIPELE